MKVYVFTQFEPSGLRCELTIMSLDWVSGCDIATPAFTQLPPVADDLLFFQNLIRTVLDRHVVHKGNYRPNLGK